MVAACRIPGALVIPVHNEVSELPAFLASWATEARPYRTVLVFDRCTDGSLEWARRWHAATAAESLHLIPTHHNPFGKSGACLVGLWQLLRLGVGPDTPVLFWDSDNEYVLDAALLEALFAAIQTTGGLVSARRQGGRLWRSRWAQGAVRLALRLRSGARVPEDVLTAVHGMPLESLLFAMNGASSFDMETRLVRYALRHRLGLQEFSVRYHPRTEGKKIRFWHLFRILETALR